jgi:hypothetical protein
MSTQENKMNQEGIWLSILEYASHKNTSISTIRRSIKAGHLKYKEENGKYFIWTKELSIKSEDLALKMELELLKKQNRDLVEEVNDLKMLLSVYEKPINQTLPPLPELEQ